MAEGYQILKAQPRNVLPETDLVVIPREGKEPLIGRFFGPNWYSKNEEAMTQHCWNSQENPDVTFRPATTSESISAVAYNFENIAKPQIFNPRWLQAGRIARWDDGVYLNVAQAIKDGNLDENILKQLRDNAKPSNGIRLGDNNFAFVSYETFEQGQQEAGKFAEGGLARGLEYVDGKIAPKLNSMASTYKGVNVICFDESKEPVSRVVVLGSGDGLLHVVGYDWSGNGSGCAFGVSSVSEPRSGESVAKK